MHRITELVIWNYYGTSQLIFHEVKFSLCYAKIFDSAHSYRDMTLIAFHISHYQTWFCVWHGDYRVLIPCPEASSASPPPRPAEQVMTSWHTSIWGHTWPPGKRPFLMRRVAHPMTLVFIALALNPDLKFQRPFLGSDIVIIYYKTLHQRGHDSSKSLGENREMDNSELTEMHQNFSSSSNSYRMPSLLSLKGENGDHTEK